MRRAPFCASGPAMPSLRMYSLRMSSLAMSGLTIQRAGLLAGAAAMALAVMPGQAAAQEADFSGSGQDGASGSAPSVPPIAGALLPATGADPSQPDLRGHLLDSFGQNLPPAPGAATTGPNWQVQPSITVSESFTDNANQFGGYTVGSAGNGGGHSADAITQIMPQVIVTGHTERIQVNLDYAPTGVIYANNSDFSQLREQFSGDVLGTAVPGLAYLDLRGSISQQPAYGGQGVINPGTLPPTQRDTQSNLSATPYVVHEFGTTGSAQAGVGYLYSATDAPDYLNGSNPPVPLALPFNYGSQWLATRRVFASFTTGENFGRLQDSIDTDNSFYDGSGALRDAHRILLTDDASYAINRFIAGLGEIGYENLSYPRSAYSFVGGVWSAGVRVTPNASSSISVEYRRIDGATAPYVHGYWQITPRLRLYGAYSAGVTTFEQDQQNSLLSGGNDQTGAAASALLAAPVVNNASLFGSNQALHRAERATANASFIAGRNVITAAFDHERSSIVGNLLGLPSSVLARLGISQAELASFGLLTSQTSQTTVGSATWRHDLTPDLSSDLQVGYNRNRVAQTAYGSYASVQFSVALNRTFTKTLSGRLAYYGNYAADGSGVSYNGQNSNTVLVSLRKDF